MGMNLTKISNSYELVKALYKNDEGKPFEMTPGQVEIFDCVWKRRDPRNHIMTYTQYGKSDIVSMAVLTRASTFAEKWPIVAPSYKKAQLIMGFVIKHIFENPYTQGKFRIGKEESEERIKRERSKQRITFRVGDQVGEIFILSGNARIKNEDAGDALLGFGAPNLLEDESALTPDKIHSKAMRMLGGHKDNFLAKIGNPFRRNHFLKSFGDPRYKKIVVDYKQGIKEGRQRKEFFEEMKKEAFFDILYECKFPEEFGPGNWIMPGRLIEDAKLTRYLEPTEKRLITCDPSMGGDKCIAFALVNTRIVDKKVWPKGLQDPMRVGGDLVEMKLKNKASLIVIDNIGIGTGITGAVRKLGHRVLPIVSSGKAEMSHLFNLKAKMWWHVGHRFIDHTISFGDTSKFDYPELKKELSSVQYVVDLSTGKIKVESKDQVKIRLKHSPDEADAYVQGVYALQFTQTTEEIKKKKTDSYDEDEEPNGSFMGV